MEESEKQESIEPAELDGDGELLPPREAMSTIDVPVGAIPPDPADLVVDPGD